MQVKAMNVVIGAGVGVIDEVVERRDINRGNMEAFNGITGWGRVAVTLAAYAGQAWGFQTGLTAPLAQSVLPLATKTVVKAILQSTSPGSTSGLRTKRAMSHNMGGGKVAWKPIPIDI